MEERRKRSHVDWFEMNIYEMQELIISSDLDAHMSNLMRTYTQSSAKEEPNNSELYHLMNKVKANHLIFTRLQRNAFKYLFEKGMVFTVEAGKYVY